MNDNDADTLAQEAVRRRRIRWVIAVGLPVIAAVTIVLLRPLGGEAPAPTAQPRPALTVTVARPGRALWPVSIEASGTVAPWQEASIGTQIGSYQLIDVRVNVGDQVRRGQVLARLNPALLRAEEAQLVARDAQARANDRRARGLQAVGGISEQETLQFTTDARAIAAQLAAKRLELRYATIVAPDDGVITARPATVGAVVPAGQELFRLIRQNRLEWRGELTAAQLALIRTGQIVALRLPDGTSARAAVRQTAPSLDAQSRVAIVYADIAAGSRARAGMYVAGTVETGEMSALTVPAECVVLRDGRSYVLQAIGSGYTTRVAQRLVQTGRRHDDAIEILQGLRGDELLVRRGGAYLNDGDIVRVIGSRGARS